MGNKQGKGGGQRSATQTGPPPAPSGVASATNDSSDAKKGNKSSRMASDSAPPPRDGVAYQQNATAVKKKVKDISSGGKSVLASGGNDSDGEDNSGPSEPMSIRNMDGSDRAPQVKVSIEDFDLLKVLGKGSFGKVMLVRKKDSSGHIYAMKTLRKAALVKRNQLLHTKTERNILQNIKHPFLTSLTYAFQTPDKLYLVMDFCGGGELFYWLKKDRRFSQNRARLFAAEILLALEALHSHDIIYRDLKPENILLDLEGHIRLTDFGLSKEAVTGAGAQGGTKTFCGTPEYLAPEILENKGHGKAVDWWSLGTLIYEMLTGLPPFYDQNMQRMYDKILNAPLRFPAYMSPEAKNLLSGLLQRKVEDRLGSGPDDSASIKNHPFFNGLDWDQVYAKEVTPEFKPPNRIGSIDTSNFDLEFTTERAIDSVVTTTMSETARDKAQFPGFTYDADVIEETAEGTN